MKKEDKICSFKLAKQLKFLGVKQDSLFYHVENELIILSFDGVIEKTNYSAFISCELDPYLPDIISTFDENGDEDHIPLYIQKTANGWCVSYPRITSHSDQNEANAKAKVLIDLIEQGYIKVNKHEA